MLTRIIILARLNQTKEKVSLLKKMVLSARKLKGNDLDTPNLDKRICIKVAEARILEWVLTDGS